MDRRDGAVDRRDDAMDGSVDATVESDPLNESDAPEPSTVTSETVTSATPTSKIQGGPLKKGVRFHAIPISEFIALQKKKKKPPLSQEK